MKQRRFAEVYLVITTIILAFVYITVLALGANLFSLSILALLAAINVGLILFLELKFRRKAILIVGFISLIVLIFIQKNGLDYLIGNWKNYSEFKENNFSNLILQVYLILTNCAIWTKFILFLLKSLRR